MLIEPVRVRKPDFRGLISGYKLTGYLHAMGYQFSLLFYIRFLSGLMALMLVYLLWKKRRNHGAFYLMLFEIFVAVWAFTDGLEAAATAFNQKLIWTQLGYIGITNSAVMFLMFSLSYTRNYSFRRNKVLWLLLVIPVITTIFAFTNQFHHLIWTRIEVSADNSQTIYYYGPWLWVHVVYEYSLILTGVIILITGALRTYTIHRIQTWLLVGSALLPSLASVLYVFKLTPIKGVDFTPVAFIISGIVIGFSIYRLEFFNILPIAHRQTIDNLEEGIVILDLHNRIMNVNPYLTRITGLEEEMVTGRNVREILSFFNTNINEFTEAEEFRVEAGIEKKGEQKYYELKLQPIREATSRKIGTLLTIRDITLNRLILDTIAESNFSRKKELKEKEILIKDLEAYARMVAHDLKNPLGAITSFSYLIEDAIKANKLSDALEMTEMLKGESNKMVKIIDDLLILSRIRKEDIRNVRIEVGSIVNEAVHRQHNLITRKNAVISMPEEWPVAYGHTQWVEQVWINLINNALKYGGNPPVIRIGWEKKDPGFVRFSINDNGKGLPPEAMERLFNDFERLGNRDAEGTGLGLSIVKRIINKMGGEIFVESANIPGEGCTFSFTLPGEKQ